MNNQTTVEPAYQRRSPKWWRLISMLVVALAFGVLMRATLLVAAPPAAADTASVGQSDPTNGGDDDDDFIRRSGVIVTRSVTATGTWVISTSDSVTFSFVVTDSTELEGALNVGQCVEVKARDTDPPLAVRVEAKDAHKCDDDDHDDDDDDDDDDTIVRHGLVTSRPVGVEGIWIIGGISYSATTSTELDQDHGELALGVCAEVEVRESNPTVAIEIESERRYKCGDDDGVQRGVLFGVIESIPANPNLFGNWVIGGMSFTVSATTEIITRGFTITPGLIVKVQFTTDVSGTNSATKIDVKFGHNNPCKQHNAQSASISHDGDPDHGKRFFGYCPGSEGRAVGRIVSRPPIGTLEGDWSIDGVVYLVTPQTRFVGDGEFNVLDRVKVEFVRLSDNSLVATKIKKADNQGGGGGSNLSIFIATVTTKPVAFVGNWWIADEPFVATMQTKFVERGALLVKGAYVLVEYDITNDMRLIRRIVAFVPPGAGDENLVGQLQATGGAMAAGAEAVLQTDEVWTVDGVDFIVSEATLLVDSGGELVPGAIVHVNSYTDNGQRYATMIRTQAGGMYIPFLGK